MIYIILKGINLKAKIGFMPKFDFSMICIELVFGQHPVDVYCNIAKYKRLALVFAPRGDVRMVSSTMASGGFFKLKIYCCLII